MATNTAVITGATQGLGRALAGELARRGWRLVLVARTRRDVDRVVEELGAETEVLGVAADICEPDGRGQIASTAARLGPIQLVINNAGTLGASPLPVLLDYDLTALRRVFEVNVVAQLAVLQALRAQLVESPTVINISSDAAVEPYARWGGYGSSKAALDQVSRVLAVENPGWRVLSVDPGDMRTAMHQAAFPGEDISDRPAPGATVPGLMRLIDDEFESGRYRARTTEEAA